MDTASLYFGGRLMKLIREKQAEMSRALLMGKALDFPDYKERAGYLRGLYDVVEWMKEVGMEDEEAASRRE